MPPENDKAKQLPSNYPLPNETDHEFIERWVAARHKPPGNWGPKFDSIGKPLDSPLNYPPYGDETGAQQMDKRSRPWSAERKAKHRKAMEAFQAKRHTRKTKRRQSVKAAGDGSEPKIVAPRGQIITIHEGSVSTWVCKYRTPELMVLSPAFEQKK